MSPERAGASPGRGEILPSGRRGRHRRRAGSYAKMTTRFSKLHQDDTKCREGLMDSDADPTPHPDPRAEQAARTAQALRTQLEPWERAVADPAQAQETVLRRLLRDYARTGYGSDHAAATVAGADGAATSPGGAATPGHAASPLAAEYRRAFPVMTYDQYRPLIDAVMAGETGLLLCEEPVGWAITRGTSREDESEVHPHDRHRSAHARQRRPGDDGLRGCHRSVSTSSRASTST